MTEILKSTDPCRCCWHCRHYIRPIALDGLLDGPITEICIVDRQTQYLAPGQRHQGDKEVMPDDYCERFEIDPPPKIEP